MAKLQSSGAISISQINTLKGRGTQTSSLDSRTLDYMGDTSRTGTARADLGVCMPNMVINKSTGQLARSSSSWVYTGPQAAWRPYSFSQFYEAYSGRPTLAVTKINLNITNQGQFQVDCSGSEAYINVNTPYSVYSSSTGSWSVCTVNNGTRITYTVSNGTYTIAVRDFLNCGANSEFKASPNPTYP